ncbi:MAG: FHA domain-containing protein [Lautropia sp.]
MQARDARIGRLLLFAAGRALREILIDRRRLAIGRRPYNDLLLDDLTVSGEHAIIHTIDGVSIIHDLKSRNGTLVNGRPVMQHDLSDGDSIDVGIYRLEYRSEALPGVASWLFDHRQSATNRDGVRTSAWMPGASLPGASLPGATLPGATLPGATGPAAPGGEPARGAPGDAHEGPRRGAPGDAAGGIHGGAAAGIPGSPFGGAPEGASGGGRGYPPSTLHAHGDAIEQPVPRTATLRWLGGDDAGRELRIDRPIVSIRNAMGQVAVVGRRQGGWCLTHMEGLAYPLVNGESIGLAAHPLRDDDLIELAGTIIQFSFG